MLKLEKCLKQSSTPYRYSQTNVITEPGRAIFPYPNFWRGEYTSELPIVVEREAGFRPRAPVERKWTPATDHAYPQHCFATPPNTERPCYPECTESYVRRHRYLQAQTPVYLFR